MVALFMSRGTANIDSLRSEENERYLVGATDLIAAVFAIRESREECYRIRREQFRSGMEKVKNSIQRSKGNDFASAVLRASTIPERKGHHVPIIALPSGMPDETPEEGQPPSSPSEGKNTVRVPELWSQPLMGRRSCPQLATTT